MPKFKIGSKVRLTEYRLSYMGGRHASNSPYRHVARVTGYDRCGSGQHRNLVYFEGRRDDICRYYDDSLELVSAPSVFDEIEQELKKEREHV